MRLLKKIFLVFLVIYPSIVSADFAATWQATSTTQGSIFPSRINGVNPYLVFSSFIATSTATDSVMQLARFGSAGGTYFYDAGGNAPTWGFNSRTGSYVAGVAGYGNLIQSNSLTGTFAIFSESNVAAGAAHSHIAGFLIDALGNIGLSSTTPGSILSIGTTNGINFVANGTSTFPAGVNFTNVAGCLAIDGTCLLARQNDWTAQQRFLTSSPSAPNGTQNERFGQGAVNNGSYGVSIGYNAVSGGPGTVYTTAVGDEAVATGQGSTALGVSSATAGNTVVVGATSQAVATGCLAIGFATYCGGTNSFALGRNTVVNNGHSGSIVIGFDVGTTAANQGLFGGDRQSEGINDIYFGTGIQPSTGAPYSNITIQSSGGAAVDEVGSNLTLAAGKSTGAATPASLIFSTGTTGGSGITLQTLTARGRFNGATGYFGLATATPVSVLDVNGKSFLEPTASTTAPSAPLTGYSGQLWNDNLQNQLSFSNGNTYSMGGNLYDATAAVTLNSTSPTTAFSTNRVGTTTIAANTLKIGQRFTVWGAGYYSTPIGNTATVTITPSIASTTATNISSVTTGIFPASATNLPYDFRLNCTVQVIGVAAKIVCDGTFNYATALTGVSPTSNSLSTVGQITFDSTVKEALDVKVSWSTVTTQTATVQEAWIDF